MTTSHSPASSSSQSTESADTDSPSLVGVGEDLLFDLPSALEDFSFLPPAVFKALSEKGITSPTPIQRDAFAPALQRRDILAQSQTGSGKTLAFALPIGLLMGAPSYDGRPRTLVLAPTRELANQVESVFATTLSSLGLRCFSIIGGGSYGLQKRALREGVDIVVGTPGRIVDLIRQGSLRLDQLECFVLDEVDQMLDIGFAEELKAVKEALPEDVQTYFFSATMNRQMEQLAHDFLQDPVSLKLSKKKLSPSSIDHRFIPVKMGQEMPALMNVLLYHNPTQGLIFCATRQECRDVAEALAQRGFNASPISGDLSQDARQSTMDRFRGGELQYLVATNVAARGLDIQALPLVINFDVPYDLESYTHRIGRTGRAGESGHAWTLVSRRNFFRYCSYLKQFGLEPNVLEIPARHEVLGKVIEQELSELTEIVDSSIPRPIRRVAERLISTLEPEEAQRLLLGFLYRKLGAIQAYDARDLMVSPEELRERPRSRNRGRRGRGAPRGGSRGGPRRGRSQGGRSRNDRGGRGGGPRNEGRSGGGGGSRMASKRKKKHSTKSKPSS